MTRSYRMWRGFQTAVELVYPPRCLACGDLVTTDFGLCGPCWCQTPFIAGVVCESCGTPLPGEVDGYRAECDECMASPRLWRDGRAALLYQGQARKLILSLKHGDRPELARPAARWMAQSGREMFHDNMLIAPVPLHWSRLVRRRYNQSALLAQYLGRECRLPVCPDLLRRRIRTPVLDGKTATERSATLSNAIVAHPRRRRLIAGRDVLLIDDVMTSGATLTACARACLEAGANHIFVLVLARVAKDA